jgi:hypothetical protein
LEGWLNAGLQAPFPAEAEFQARAQIGVIEPAQVFRTETCVQRQEGLAAELPSSRQLRQRLCPATAAHAWPDLDQIERYSKVLDQRALQLARERTREVGKSRLQHIALPEPGGLIRRVAGHQIGDQVGFGDRRVQGAFQIDSRCVETAGNVGYDRYLFTPDGAHHVHRADIEAGVQVAKVSDRAAFHGEVAGDGPYVERIAPPQGVERTRGSVGFARLAEQHLTPELNVGLVGS